MGKWSLLSNMASTTSTQQDVEILESWEDIDSETDVLEKKFNKLLAENKSLDNRTNGSVSNHPVKIILTGEDALRSHIVQPEPTVKILKRPTKDTQCSNDARVYQPKKTLQQRELEYAQARARILGEAVPEKIEDKILIQNKVKTNEIDNVIRHPKGPDGTTGFKVRR